MSNKVKNIALDKMISIILRNSDKSPERCTRNLLELGSTLRKDSSKAKDCTIYQAFLELCKHNEINQIKELFYHIFID